MFIDIDVWQLHAAIPCACVRYKISIYNPWESEEFKTACKLVFNRLSKLSVSSLYFLNKPSPKKKHFNAEIRLPYSNWFDHLKFLFSSFKLFISSWSLWSNSTHPDKSSRVKNSIACRRTKYGNWIRSEAGIKYKCWKSKAGYFGKAWDTLHGWTKS